MKNLLCKGMKELNPIFVGYLWLVILATICNMGYCMFSFEKFRPIAVVGQLLEGVAIVTGAFLMLCTNKLGYYLVMLTVLVTAVSCIVLFLSGYHIHDYSSIESVLVIVLSCVFWIFILRMLMRLQKEGQDAFQVLGIEG